MNDIMTKASRKLRAAVAVYAAIGLSIFSLSAQAADVEKRKLTIAVSGAASDIDKLGYAIALQKGYFKEEGLDISNLDMFSGSKALQALVGGSVDAVEGSYEHTLRMQPQGVSLTCLGVFARYPGIVMMAVKSKENSIKSGADLKGKKIGISAPGSAMHTFAAAIMKKAGIDPKEASFIAVGVGASALAAVQTGGELDVLVSVDPVVTQLVQSGEAKVIVDSRNGDGAKVAYGGIYPAGCIYVPHDFIAKNPNTAQALTNAMVHSMKWLQSASIDDIVKTIPKTYYQDENVYRQAVESNLDLFRWDGIITPEMSEENVLNAISLLDPKLRDAKIDFSTTYDNSLTRKALEKFR
jgi:NitT/TauT family transport system substrate-binding protein